MIFTRAPVATGISPPLSIMRPALISRSASLCMASIRAGVGPRMALGRGNDIHEAHGKSPVEASRGRAGRKTVSLLGRRLDHGRIDSGSEKIAPAFRMLTGGDSPARELRFHEVGQDASAAIRFRTAYCCRTMISGSALSGTRRHCALSSASNCQVSPLGRHQQHLAALEPPLRRREGRDRGIAFRLQEDLEIVAARLRCWSASGRRSRWPLPRTIDQSPIIWSIDLASERAAARFCRM